MKKLFSEIPYIEGDRLILKQITREDTSAIRELVSSDVVYKMEPTFLFERKYDVEYVIDHLYDECFKESIILGIYSRENEGPFAVWQNSYEDWGYDKPLPTDKWIK